MRRTTISLPDELHEQLRRDAFRTKTSMAEITRAKRQFSVEPPRRRRTPQDPLLKVAGICRGPVLSDGIDDALYGLDPDLSHVSGIRAGATGTGRRLASAAAISR